MSCGIGLLQVDGIKPGELVSELFAKHKILATPITVAGQYEGVRITPNIYTTLREIDTFCEVIEKRVGA